MDTPKRLYFMVGRIGSGKGTQAKLLADELGCAVFSTGDEFRKEIASATLLGRAMQETYDKGLFMPAWIPDFFLVRFLLGLPEDKNAVFEGSGRDLKQAETVESVAGFLGRPYTVFNFEVSEDTVVKRSLARGRTDGLDKDEATIRARLEVNRKLIEPAIEYFRSVGKLIDINGEPSVEDIHAAVMTHVTHQDA